MTLSSTVLLCHSHTPSQVTCRLAYLFAMLVAKTAHHSCHALKVEFQCVPAGNQDHAGMQQVSITMIATGFGSGVVEAALRPAARRQPQQQQQQQQTPARQVPVERYAPPRHHLAPCKVPKTVLALNPVDTASLMWHCCGRAAYKVWKLISPRRHAHYPVVSGLHQEQGIILQHQQLKSQHSSGSEGHAASEQSSATQQQQMTLWRLDKPCLMQYCTWSVIPVWMSALF